MRVCYADESGHCGVKVNHNQPIEVLCGVTTDLSKLFKTQKEHNGILDLLSGHGIKIKEFKAAEMHRGRKEWHGIDPDIRDVVYDALLNWSKSRVCKFVVCPIDTQEFFNRKNAGCEISAKLQYPWEAGALNVVLAIQRENRGKKNNKGRTIMVFDEQKKHDERFLDLFDSDLSFTDGFTGYTPRPRTKSDPRLDQIVDVPHFSKSHLTVLIQLADAAAYIVNRHLCMTECGFPEDYVGEQKKIAKWYALIAQNCIKHTSIDPPGKDDLCVFYREVRPGNWTAKTFVEQ
jgi:hypothetical protein